jgi:hypothetical protein
MDANSTIWTPTAQYGRQQHKMEAYNSWIFAEIRQKVVRTARIYEERHEKE